MARFGSLGTRYFNNSGEPLIGGKIWFFQSGSTTPKTTYSDPDQTIPNPNPVVLDAAGVQPPVFFNGTAKAVLTNAQDVQLQVVDPVGGVVSASSFGPWNAILTYVREDIVQADDARYYISTANDNLGNNPTSEPTKWMELRIPSIWNATYQFRGGDLTTGSDNALYQCVVTSSTNVDPTDPLQTDWTQIGASGWSSLVEDLTPRLGGNLDLNGNLVGAASAADLTKLAAVTASAAELNHSAGVTSAIQTQLNAKAPSASPTFSGTVTLPGLWTMVVNGGHLEFRYNGTAVYEIQTTGATIQSGHATWNGTP